MQRGKYVITLTFIIVAMIESIIQLQYLRYNNNQRIVMSTTSKFDPSIRVWIESPIDNPTNRTSSENHASLLHVRIRDPSYQQITTAEKGEKYVQNQEAVVEYQKRVRASNARAWQCSQRQQHSIDLSWVQNCLQLTTSSATTTTAARKLEYPMDADQHFHDIRLAVSQYAQHSNHKMHSAKQYAGPWIENAYISYFESLYDDDSSNRQHQPCLSDIFGPFVPIFLPWVDHLVVASHPPQQRHQYPDGLVRTLLEILRPNVPYITISQNDEGIVGKYEFNSTTSLPNLLVLSAGGYGNVPIPLLKQEEPYITDRIPIMDRIYDVSYVGSLKNAPHGMRRKMHDAMLRFNSVTTKLIENDPQRHDFRYKYYYGPDWRSVVQNSKFSLVPRGFGRSAYHLMEVLQMGYIPIYVYLTNDTPWIPYLDVYINEIGYMTDMEHLSELLYYLHYNASIAELQYREERIAALRDTHFTMNGVMVNQIQGFMMGHQSFNTQNGNFTDLQCQSVPSTLTGK